MVGTLSIEPFIHHDLEKVNSVIRSCQRVGKDHKG